MAGQNSKPAISFGGRLMTEAGKKPFRTRLARALGLVIIVVGGLHLFPVKPHEPTWSYRNEPIYSGPIRREYTDWMVKILNRNHFIHARYGNEILLPLLTWFNLGSFDSHQHLFTNSSWRVADNVLRGAPAYGARLQFPESVRFMVEHPYFTPSIFVPLGKGLVIERKPPRSAGGKARLHERRRAAIIRVEDSDPTRYRFVRWEALARDPLLQLRLRAEALQTLTTARIIKRNESRRSGPVSLRYYQGDRCFPPIEVCLE